MSEDDELKSAINFMALNKEENKRKRDLDKAILSGDSEDIAIKRKIYEKVKETKDEL